MPFLPLKVLVCAVAAGMILICVPRALSAAGQSTDVDLNLVVAIDSSQSVDEDRYRMQIEGIAAAFENKMVTDAILSGYHGAINISVVSWADASVVSLDWQRIDSTQTAREVAAKVRKMQKYGGEFTCLGRMLRHLHQAYLAGIDTKKTRTVVDVSGDGIDNCDERTAVAEARDRLVKSGVTINGLPIVTEEGRIVGAGAYRAPGNPMEPLPASKLRETLTLDVWYKRNLIGGFGAFIQKAEGYKDFGRAMRQKLFLEISGNPPAFPLASRQPQDGKMSLGLLGKQIRK